MIPCPVHATVPPIGRPDRLTSNHLSSRPDPYGSPRPLQAGYRAVARHPDCAHSVNCLSDGGRAIIGARQLAPDRFVWEEAYYIQRGWEDSGPRNGGGRQP